MANLIAGLIGTPTTTQTRGGQEFTTRTQPLGRARTLYDILQRNLMGPSITLPETPISAPLARSVAAYEDMMPAMMQMAFGPRSSGGLASRLTLPSTTTAEAVPVFGRTPTREELGLPSRREYFPFTPTAEEMTEVIGLPNIRTGATMTKGLKQIRGLERKQGKVTGRIERREAAGKPTTQAEKRLAQIEERLARKRVRYQ